MSKVLLVIDMQEDFVTGVLGTPEAISIVPRVVDKITHYRDGNIIATMDYHDKDYLCTNEGKHIPIAHCIERTTGWYLDRDISRALQSMPTRNISILLKDNFAVLV